jgi:hypothetical protein
MKFLLPALIIIVLVFIFRPKQKMTVPPNARAGDLTLEPCEYKTKARTYRAECGTLVVPEVTAADARRLFGIGTDRFLISWLDVT